MDRQELLLASMLENHSQCHLRLPHQVPILKLMSKRKIRKREDARQKDMKLQMIVSILIMIGKREIKREEEEVLIRTTRDLFLMKEAITPDTFDQ